MLANRSTKDSVACLQRQGPILRIAGVCNSFRLRPQRQLRALSASSAKATGSPATTGSSTICTYQATKRAPPQASDELSTQPAARHVRSNKSNVQTASRSAFSSADARPRVAGNSRSCRGMPARHPARCRKAKGAAPSRSSPFAFTRHAARFTRRVTCPSATRRPCWALRRAAPAPAACRSPRGISRTRRGRAHRCSSGRP